jgi:hypothetical protein
MHDGTRLGGVPAAPKISAQDEATILARHATGGVAARAASRSSSHSA